MEACSELLSIFVCSPNEYKDVFGVYYQSFKKYWPDCPFELTLATNNQEYIDIHVINNWITGDSWTERALPVLNQISSKYVLLMCDDIFFSNSVDNYAVYKILEFMEENSINFYRLKPHVSKKCASEELELYYVHKQMPYGKNLQMGIYNRKYLLEQLGDGTLSAWDIEAKWNQDATEAPDEYFEDVISSKTEVIKVLHGIVKGRWLPTVRKKLIASGVFIDSLRECLSLHEEVKYNLITVISERLNPKVRLKLKKMFSSFGMKFTGKN